MSTEEMRVRTDRFARRIRVRNLIEYCAAAIVIASFCWYLYALPGGLVKTGCGMVILGTLFVVWQLHRRAAPLESGGRDCMGHLQSELVRQRDALRSVALWYLGPFVPGMTVFLAGLYRQVPQARFAVLLTAAATVAVFTMIWVLNAWAATRLQKQIDALHR